MGRLCLLVFLSLAWVLPNMSQEISDPVAIARKALDLLLAGEHHHLHEMFDEGMSQALSEEVLRAKVAPVLAQVGKVESIGEPQVQHTQQATVVVFPVRFASGNLNVIVSVDKSGRIAGLFLTPGQSAAGKGVESTPGYVKPEAFRDREVTIGSGEWKLGGTLSIPVGHGPFPAVVLVQGSGPNDRDETIGANKPFRDIAEGLASRGIAVLRYDKRTFVYGPKMAGLQDLTVNQETIDDALTAIAFLSVQPEIDPKRVFLLGHSLGGYLAPRIAEHAPNLAGVIIMAGSTRPLETLMLEQFPIPRRISRKASRD